ncbi:SOS response-associated peptidase [Oenococcus kitaharae]|uniref:Abasic site processing protein n=1 Tax=Oenococcus kitaharae DSM 17330 TaxID=1045004 RepID=G9WHW3_9LACO|nr:SOS response-associated peptidase family protein [Oenococcus kitaharae]EHN58848.1 hypothetical protein OKIT_0739 [Oenococcus kitaharae DSM 17330]OEY81819.1 hypothetical protein NT96_08645 [Oenococcus kitaharae]OEY84050.1 hypothetical protein NT95_02705 [Oenococcus kitaharae]OEY85592.1 hypothetical protein NV75_03730 [Oenococcus kitaharae]
MCGRYTFQSDFSPEISQITRLAQANGYEIKTGEVFPGDTTAVVIADQGKIKVVGMAWGFPIFGNKRLLINARSETLLEKRTFSESFKKRRCVYPTTGFFEWNLDKEKVWFNYADHHEALYIAGCYNFFDGQARSVLFTTEPNQSVAPVHNRMPLILKKTQIAAWLSDFNAASEMIANPMPELFSKKV